MTENKTVHLVFVGNPEGEPTGGEFWVAYLVSDKSISGTGVSREHVIREFLAAAQQRGEPDNADAYDFQEPTFEDAWEDLLNMELEGNLDTPAKGHLHVWIYLIGVLIIVIFGGLALYLIMGEFQDSYVLMSLSGVLLGFAFQIYALWQGWKRLKERP
jgi:hypothetical protein